tara:strand:- start:146 stop:256 length:111 start_codon:yes stop_codon:yes gene_type:complete
MTALPELKEKLEKKVKHVYFSTHVIFALFLKERKVV